MTSLHSSGPIALALASVLTGLAAAPAYAQAITSVSDLQLKAEADASGAEPLNSLKTDEPVDEAAPLRKPPPGAKPAPKAKPGDLPPTKPYPHAQRVGLRGGTGEPAPSPTTPPVDSTTPPGPTVAVPEPPPARRKIPADPNPFDPVGIRLGDIDLKPYVEQDLGYATNPLGLSSKPQGSGLETTEAGVSWQSVWSRDDFHGALKGGYTDYFQTPDASGAYASGNVDGRIDASRDLALDAEGRFNILPEPLSNFGLSTGVNGNPYIQTATWGATVGATQKFGDLSIGLHGAFDQQLYQDVPLYGAGASGLSADDYDDWSLKLKTAYRISEVISPYFEVDVDTRRYANGVDALGYQADSDGASLLAGADVSFSQMLSGELALGYGQRTYQDPRLPFASTPLIDASLIWSVTPLTTFTLKANTAINDAILAGASADINHTYSIEASHSLTRQLLLSLIGTYGTDSFVGSTQTDQNWSVAAKAEYHMTRDLVFKLTATHTAYLSNVPNTNSNNNTVMIGVRWQR